MYDIYIIMTFEFFLCCCCHDKYHELSITAEEWVYCPLQVRVHHLVKPKWELKAGNQRQKRNQRPWKNGAYWLTLHGLLGLTSYTTQDDLPRCDSTCSGLGPPTPISNHSNAPLICSLASLMESVSQLRLPPPK